MANSVDPDQTTAYNVVTMLIQHQDENIESMLFQGCVPAVLLCWFQCLTLKVLIIAAVDNILTFILRNFQRNKA